MNLSDALAIARSPGYSLTAVQAGALRELVLRAARRHPSIADGKTFIEDHIDVLKLCNDALPDPDFGALLRSLS
jgi:hypothetical protein